VIGLYATQGYGVLMVDYIGYGVDYETIHPYVLYPEQNIKTVLYALEKV